MSAVRSYTNRVFKKAELQFLVTEIQGFHWGYTKALVIVESYTGDVCWAWHMKETQKQNTTFYSQRMMKWPEKSNELWFKINVNDPISMMCAQSFCQSGSPVKEESDKMLLNTD